ncbi:MAG: hypothetical protein WCV80_02370 [Candidatus Paceibacterota bacterium]|jgi:hypothetical protein
MDSILKNINDPGLHALVGCITMNMGKEKIAERFKEIQSQYPQYDKTFLWLLAYSQEHSPDTQRYIEANYKKFHQCLDSGFPKKLSAINRFESHMWEMILCDTLSASGKLIPKSAAGADLILETPKGQLIQIEAIAPDEAEDEGLRAERPDYSKGNMFSSGGNIEDMENPILLRCTHAFDQKANKAYKKDQPFIIAINTSKVVGIVSLDDFIIRRVLLGLGCVTITRKPDGSHQTGLQQKNDLKKPNGGIFPVARFRDPNYKHVSGVIYTSQSSIGLIPGGWGWSNSGIFYVPNPMATHKVDVDFNFFKTIICDEVAYREIPAKRDFVTSF